MRIQQQLEVEAIIAPALILEGNGKKEQPQRTDAVLRSPHPRLQLSWLTQALMTSAVMPNSASPVSASPQSGRQHALQLVRSPSTTVLNKQVLWQEATQGKAE